MKRAIQFFSFLALLGLGACERHISNANLNQVKADMSPKEVESILGPPTRTEYPAELNTQLIKTLPVTRYIYEQNGKTVELIFVADKLADGKEAIKGTFDK